MNKANQQMEKAEQITSKQASDIRYAMQWMGGDKLFGVVHVKGAAWVNVPTGMGGDLVQLGK